MKIKTSELTGAALDWAVAKCEGIDFTRLDNGGWTADCFTPSEDWSHGGPIIEREGIATDFDGSVWCASYNELPIAFYGPTPLIAAMRCYCCSKLGDEVEIPK